MKNEMESAPATGAHPSTPTPTNRPAHLSAAQEFTPTGLAAAQEAAEGSVIALNRVYATVSALACSDATEEEFRECFYSVMELLRPIQADAQRALDLLAAHRRQAA